MIRRLLRDPLAHFLLGGAILWLVIAWRGEEADPASRAIAVSRARQAALALNYEQLMGRPPTDRELAGLVAGDVHEEVLYREALRLGLDQDDPVIRRRLAKKMDELASAEAESAEPSESELRRWLADHPARFADDITVSFAQSAYPTEQAALAALTALRAGGSASGEALDLPATVTAMPAREVRERFGAQFADGLAQLEAGAGWQGPLPSGLGWHVVHLDNRHIGTVPRFEAIRARVLEDWRGATMAARREAAYRVLRDGYRVSIAR